MGVSSRIGRAAAHLKNAIDNWERKPLSGEATRALVEEAIRSLQEISTQHPAPKKNPSNHSIPTPTPNLQIYSMIIEYLINNGAIESAKTLIEELPESTGLETENDSISLYKIYSPWQEELGLSSEESLYRQANYQQELAEIQQEGREALQRSTDIAQKRTPYLDRLYQPIRMYLARKSQLASDEDKEKLLQKVIVEIRSGFIFEGSSLICREEENTFLFSRHSQEYQTVLHFLSLLVTPLHHSEVSRRHQKSFFTKTGKRHLPLEILYHVGKKMESININPYDTETEPIESAAPALLSFHSSFVCPVLRSECTIDNFPCILTCGHVISTRALKKIALFKGSPFKCPYCPRDIHLKEVFRLTLPI
ncbi:hypothetical protein NEHOM01_0882 [Nematocida homosporus]|uniref:uncharacterized protein n=1 Tax=Nematocida homosporus TaxID=1912981 RepID=UPI00222093A1|nr:uncharacterized protein NEHOM01_0882 [Nematocida homosporus]KAI5185523.1 hypothetical protein NEHOM01_0882 [Nematocida homosporus]